ncbi:MAG: hypothetical protein J6565_07600 [Lactobacillus sp.]|nr:hypothetical protein [Lactobacillus sp.]
MSLVNSNRSVTDFKPKKMMTMDDLAEEKATKSVTFDTSIRISNHLKNKLQAMIALGYTSTIKGAIALTFDAYYNNLSDSEKRDLDVQIKTFEKRDAKLKK